MSNFEGVRPTLECIGIADYKNQLFRRFQRDGFEFNIMVVGETGLGKTTFINNLFLSNIGQLKTLSTTKVIQERTFYLVEENTRVKITLVDTPGFGNQINNCYCWRPLVEYIDKKNSEYLNRELKIYRPIKIPDTRIHVCLYFINPNGHGMKEIDKKCIKKLHDKVNLIPIISKADTLTKTELDKFKQTIINDIHNEGIKIYNFPEDSTTVENTETRHLPYAIVCSTNTIIDKNGLKIRVRQYPWGQVEVDNLDHNDFVLLKNNLMKKHLIDLILDTNNVHYENYRYTKLSQVIEKNDYDKIMGKKEQVFADSVKKRINIIEKKERQLDIIINEKINVLDNKKRRLEKLSKEVEKIKISCPSLFVCHHKHSPTAYDI
uniref:Septin n=1 Tax=Strongyloides papillosus TaxID=174720 RepID=A0A0N5C8D6_STREA